MNGTTQPTNGRGGAMEAVFTITATIFVYAGLTLYLRANPCRQQMRWSWAFFHAWSQRRAIVLRRERADDEIDRTIDVGSPNRRRRYEQAARKRRLAEEALIELDTD